MAARAICAPLIATNFLLCVHKQTVVSGPKVVRNSLQEMVHSNTLVVIHKLEKILKLLNAAQVILLLWMFVSDDVSLDIFFPLGWSVTQFTIINQTTTGLLYQPSVMMNYDDCGAIGGMLVRGNRSTRRKPAPVPLCAPQVPRDLTRSRTRAAAVGSRRLTA
jgi:hypothetical protein